VLCATGRLCFVFSRLRVIDEESERGKPKLSTLSFEDFLEALVRVATMKALPTYAELALLGARDAGTFLIGLRAKNPTGYAAFVKARERGWEDTLRQPIQRCLEHLLSLLLRTIETVLLPPSPLSPHPPTNTHTHTMRSRKSGVPVRLGPCPFCQEARQTCHRPRGKQARPPRDSLHLVWMTMLAASSWRSRPPPLRRPSSRKKSGRSR
jgi:hypothetical protein